MSDQRLLNTRQVAERLGLKESTIRAWILRRKLPYVRCGRSVRVAAKAVDEFVDRNTIPAKEEQR